MAECGEATNAGQGDVGGKGVVERGEGNGMGRGGRVFVSKVIM